MTFIPPHQQRLILAVMTTFLSQKGRSFCHSKILGSFFGFICIAMSAFIDRSAHFCHHGNILGYFVLPWQHSLAEALLPWQHLLAKVFIAIMTTFMSKRIARVS